MEYVAYAFGIFGLLAFLNTSSLEKRLSRLEEQLTRTKGTMQYESRRSLEEASRKYVGMKVKLEFKEDFLDFDVINYGNTKHGSNTILDVDQDWLLVRIDTPKGSKEKLLRMQGVQSIQAL